MKFIFRYSLLSNFPNKDSQITQQQLTQALQSVNFDFKRHDLNYLQELCITCVQKLLTRPQQKVATIIDNIFGSSDRQIPQYNVKELQNIWQQEKVNIYRSILSRSCGSGSTFKEMEWSVRNVIMRRSQWAGKRESVLTRMRLKTVEKSEDDKDNGISLVIDTGARGFQKLYSSLEECQNAINQILLSSQQ